MTKTLTEQWREGTLESGMYYWQLSNNETFMATLYKMDEYKQTKDASKIICLAPVPSYEEWHKVKDLGLRPDYTDHIEKWEDCARLTKQLAIATKALKEINKNYRFTVAQDVVYKALKEMEGVK